MNVIIAQDKSVRCTKTSNDAYNLQDIKFYISKALSFEEATLNLKIIRNTYPFMLCQTGDSTNYNIYSVIFTVPTLLSARAYDLEVVLDADNIYIGNFELEQIKVNPVMRMMSMRSMTEADTLMPYGLTDKNAPIDIVDREIKMANNQNTIIAEDNISQSITFRLPKTYEGIDLTTKDMYFDYIDPIDDVTIRNIKFENFMLDEDDNTLFKIVLPVTSALTQKVGGGIIKFALSAIDPLDSLTENMQYIWQTQPATLTILPNLGKRNSIITPPYAESPELIAIQEQIDEIKQSDVYLLDPDINDQEVTFDSGGAPTYD